MNRNFFAALVLGAVSVGLMGCPTTPPTEEKRDRLHDNVQNALDGISKTDPGASKFINDSYGYVVFPTIGKGGLIVGGSYGHGEVYEAGKMIGYADMTQATIGLQAGGQEFCEVLAFENKAALDRFVNNRFQFAAQATAVALKSGAAANAKYTDGVAIFAHIKGGLMAEAAVGGQKFEFKPLR